MPIIARHLRRDPYQPACDWPDDCAVQWGGSGLVFGENSTRSTAFFEVFPDGAGFLRGEGATVEEAEQAAFAKWTRQSACAAAGGHRWSRTRRMRDGRTHTYTNGGTFCLACGAFTSKILPPIVKLGSWREPLSASDLSLLAMGGARPEGGEPPGNARHLELRAKAAGIDLPDWRTFPDTDEDETYEAACDRTVAAFYATHLAHKTPSEPGLSALFDGFSEAGLRASAVHYGFLPATPPES